MLYESVKELIGNTPLVHLKRFTSFNNLDSNIYGKLEKYNLAGSIKDRVAMQMILDAFKDHKIKKGDTIIEPTSGNTGIALSCLANLFELNCIIVMPSSMSLERIKTIEAYGSKVVLTDAKLGMKGSIAKAEELNQTIPNSLILGQFDNPSCIEAHYQTTAREIIKDLEGVDIVVSGIGTGGTISGIGKYLKEVNPNILIIGVEPESSPLITQNKVGSHKIQGIGANFIPDNLKLEYVDKVLRVSDDDAYKEVRSIAKVEGLFVGISSGAALSAAKEVSKLYPKKNIVVILPDSLDRYLSTNGLLDKDD